MALGYFKIKFDSIVLPYNDEQTPVSLTGKKMLPIWQDSSITMNESIDIIKHLDRNDLFSFKKVSKDSIDQMEVFLNDLGKEVHSLAMPYWIFTKEFDESSRSYFQSKKEIKRGPFKDLVRNKDKFVLDLDKKLHSLEKNLIPFYKSDRLSIFDIMLASHLWGLYVVAEFQFSEKVHSYLQTIKKLTDFDYHRDYWES